ncbi:MAG: stage II sporulation protein R [Oscillospiraceae bacterium]|nr:stage II sporulation protein R [Oscillospiraceae bacterium]
MDWIKEQETHSRSLRRWELALLLGLAVSILVGVWLDGQQAALAQKLVRLHVVANSDTEADQALKLRVRDAVLAEAAGLIPAGAGPEEAEAVLAGHLEDLASAGAAVVGEAGYTYPVTASLEHQVHFPTRQYTQFSLPAGEYTALRVVIGSGAGHNWWCVIFPPLCLGSVTEAAAPESGLTEQEVALITGEEEGYLLKFRALELWDQFKEWVDGDN